MRIRHVSALIPALALFLATSAAAQAPMYRVYRGFRLAEVPAETFPAVLARDFLPAAPRVMKAHSLVSYVPALPPLEKPTSVPDEIAIVVYGSEEAYKGSWEDPAVKEYGRLHGDYFEGSRTGRTRTGTAVPFGRTLESETPVDVIGEWVDWQTGYTGVYIGLRRPDFPREEFLERLTSHLVLSRESMTPLGMDGYIVVGNEDMEIAWVHWPSAEVMQEAFATEAGQKAGADAAAFMDTLMWAEAGVFDGSFEYGQAVTVRFEPEVDPPVGD